MQPTALVSGRCIWRPGRRVHPSSLRSSPLELSRRLTTLGASRPTSCRRTTKRRVRCWTCCPRRGKRQIGSGRVRRLDTRTQLGQAPAQVRARRLGLAPPPPTTATPAAAVTTVGPPTTLTRTNLTQASAPASTAAANPSRMCRSPTPKRPKLTWRHWSTRATGAPSSSRCPGWTQRATCVATTTPPCCTPRTLLLLPQPQCPVRRMQRRWGRPAPRPRRRRFPPLWR